VSSRHVSPKKPTAAKLRSWSVSIIRKAVSRRETFREVPESGIEPTVPAQGARIGMARGSQTVCPSAPEHNGPPRATLQARRGLALVLMHVPPASG
jgi:hypothetical protein